MTETAARFEKVTAGFTARVEAVRADAWGRPAPCEGWVARDDVVRHLVEVFYNHQRLHSSLG